VFLKVGQDELEEELLPFQIQPFGRVNTDKPSVEGNVGIDPVASGLLFGAAKVDAIVRDEGPVTF